MKDITNKQIKLSIQLIDNSKQIPEKPIILQWVNLTLETCHIMEEYELTVRIVSKEEIKQLNKQFRSMDTPTNILSFEDEIIPGCRRESLGDLVICPTVLEEEAIAQNKSIQNHWAHIIIHGVLHLLGYDHQSSLEAADVMETLEVGILQKLNIANPYESEK